MRSSWRTDLQTRNTFLDCRSPWIDVEVVNDILQAEAGRPKSDPSSNRSSRSSSLSSNAGATRSAVPCRIGEAVIAEWVGNGEWYTATVESFNRDGTITVNWQDGDGSYRVLRPEQVDRREHSAVESSSHSKTSSGSQDIGLNAHNFRVSNLESILQTLRDRNDDTLCACEAQPAEVRDDHPDVSQIGQPAATPATRSSEHGAIEIESLLQNMDRAGSHPGAAAASAPPPVAIDVWTPGAEGHEELKCTPCKFLFKAGSCREGETCNFCHLKHESGHPKLKFRPCKGKRDRFRKMIPRLQEQVAKDGREINLDDLDYVLPSIKDNQYLKAKVLKKILGEDAARKTELASQSTAGPSSSPIPQVVGDRSGEPRAEDESGDDLASI